jgi:hypothetical protein
MKRDNPVNGGRREGEGREEETIVYSMTRQFYENLEI